MKRSRLPIILLAGILVVAERAIAETASSGNLPMPPADLTHRLAQDAFVILAAQGAGGGVMGAKKLTLQFEAEPRTLNAKWKATGPSGDSWNNSPRREIGAYASQSLFLDADAYLVPPTVARCIPLDTYRPLSAHPQPTFEGTHCVFGMLTGWLENVTQPDPLFDRARFAHDSAYASRFANLNLLHYLIDHRDSRANNFLMSTDPADPRVFSIDNGIAFGGTLYNFFTWHYNTIRVSALSRASIERLRHVSRDDLDRLGVLAELALDADGILRNVALAPNRDPESGTRSGPWGIQLGLTRAEIDAVAERLHALLVRIDAGELHVF